MTSETGVVVATNVSAEKGTVKHPVDEIRIDEKGIVGDAHAGPWHRQVSVLALESVEKFSSQAGRQIGHGEFAENITTGGIDLGGVAVLDRFGIGQVELEVTQIGKKCHGDGCAIYREVGQCIMPKEGIFCRVLSGGTVKAGDAIEYKPRALRILVVTLSDRASRGEYEDRSGPEIRTMLDDFFADKRWHAEIDGVVIPDDAQRLEKTLRSSDVDVIFTTGGTGVGPRDITPDVVMRMADKTIPGVMEHIRLKFGQDKPNALLSRSVAAVFGKCLIYTLPGSVRAVREYMGEILKTIEHLIVTVHGLDTH